MGGYPIHLDGRSWTVVGKEVPEGGIQVVQGIGGRFPVRSRMENGHQGQLTIQLLIELYPLGPFIGLLPRVPLMGQPVGPTSREATCPYSVTRTKTAKPMALAEKPNQPNHRAWEPLR